MVGVVSLQLGGDSDIGVAIGMTGGAAIVGTIGSTWHEGLQQTQ